jgi:hypothetical protein
MKSCVHHERGRRAEERTCLPDLCVFEVKKHATLEVML